jgi:hypothetical protein
MNLCSHRNKLIYFKRALFKKSSIIVILSVSLLLVKCIWVHKEVNCSARILLTIVNNDTSSLTLKMAPGDLESTDIERISADSIVLNSLDTCEDTIYYRWKGSDNCILFCDGLYGSQTVLVKPYKKETEFSSYVIYPCDSTISLSKTICNGCNAILYDTLRIP